MCGQKKRVHVIGFGACLKPMKFTAPNQIDQKGGLEIDQKAGLEIDWPKNRLIGSAPTMQLNPDHHQQQLLKKMKIEKVLKNTAPHP